MSGVQVDQKAYEMPPLEGLSVAHFHRNRHRLVGTLLRKGLGARILSMVTATCTCVLACECLEHRILNKLE